MVNFTDQIDDRGQLQSRRALKKAEVRDRLTRSALDLFARRGIEGTTVEAITDAAGVAKGTFFNYFGSKDEVLADHYWRLVERSHHFAKRLPVRPARAWLERFYRHLARTVASAPLLTRVVLGETAHPMVRRLERRSWEDNRQLIVGVLEEGRRAGEIRPGIHPETALRVMSSVWTATLNDWIHAEQGFGLVGEVGRRLGVVLDGIAPPERT